MNRVRAIGIGLFSALASLAPGCESSGNRGSETHWLSACVSGSSCGSGLSCVCGTCTVPCSSSADCGSLGPSAACATASAASAACAGFSNPPQSLCLARCAAAADCPASQACVQGTCVPNGSQDAGTGPFHDAGTGGIGGTGGSGGHAGSSHGPDASASGGASGSVDASADAGLPPSTEGGAVDASRRDAGATLGDGSSAFQVVSVSPVGSAVGVAASSVVTAAFSASVDPATVGAAFSVSGPAAPVSGHVTATAATATFTPEGALPLACKLTATLGASVADLGGHPLGAPYSWPFATADGSFRGETSPGGAAYTDGFLYFGTETRIAVSRDGSVFAGWAAFDATATNDFGSVSRYTAAAGWVPFVDFDDGKHPNGIGALAPAVAVSDHGEAMVVWDHGTLNAGAWEYSLRAMRYAGGWQAPVTLEGPQALNAPAQSYVLGADANGGFVVAWIGQDAPVGARMAHFDPRSGWGPVEAPPLYGADAGLLPRASNPTVSVNASGHALVAWRESVGPLDPRTPDTMAVERFDPATGWSGKEVLAGYGSPYVGAYSVPSAALGDDGTAAVAWTQVLDPYAKHRNGIVRTFDGTWASPVILNSNPGLDVVVNAVVATDSQGNYISGFTNWTFTGQQVYAARKASGGAWSPPVLLNSPEGPPDGAPTWTGESGPWIAMSRTGDAILQMSETPVASNVRTLDVVTYSPKDGWSKTTRLSANVGPVTQAQLDDCGNGAVAWIDLPSNDVKLARHLHGGTWSQERVASAPSAVYEHVALGVGPSGQIVVTYRSPDDHSQRANVLE